MFSRILPSFLAASLCLLIATPSGADVPPDFITSWPTSGKPASIVVDCLHNNLVYVACENGTVEKYSSSGVLLRSWIAGNRLNGIGVDVVGNIFVADFLVCKIKKFTSEGLLLLQWGTCTSGDSAFTWTSDVAADATGNVHALDYGHRVLVFSPSGTFIRSYASPGPGDGQLNNPRGLTIHNGYVFIADTENRGGRIQKFTTAGQFLTLWSEGMQNPFEVAVDPVGNVYVPDYWGHRIMKFTSEGTLLATWGSQGQAVGQFQNPRGIACDSFGNVYVADTEMYRIQKFGYAVTPIEKVTWSSVKNRTSQSATGTP
jgi:DNA-binding beta-propeller fold protein YncE